MVNFISRKFKLILFSYKGGGMGHGGVGERVFIQNLLVQIHLIIEMTFVDRPRAMGG